MRGRDGVTVQTERANGAWENKWSVSSVNLGWQPETGQAGVGMTRIPIVAVCLEEEGMNGHGLPFVRGNYAMADSCPVP